MATCIPLSLLLVVLPILSLAVPENGDLLVAVEEMRRANYFTFVTLINMSPPSSIPGNITFFMPKDRILSNANLSLSHDSVSEFLLRHSVPSPLLFGHLVHIPTGSIIPTSIPNYIMRVDNGGRRSFFLNSVRLISPNLCIAGSTIRCHGIEGVLPGITMQDSDIPASSPHCRNTTNPGPVVGPTNPPASPPVPPPVPSSSVPNSPDQALEAAPAPAPGHPFPAPEKSACPPRWMIFQGHVKGLTTCLLFSIIVHAMQL